MSKTLFCLSALALVTCGCDNNFSSLASIASQHISYKTPIVSIVPVIDNTKSAYEWNISDELSSALYAHLSQRDHVILSHSSQVRAKSLPFLEENSPFDTEVTSLKKSFQNEEFVAFLELIEHEEVLHQNKLHPEDPHSCSAELRIGMRVRVFDLRGKEPRIILQELLHDTHPIHAQFNHLNFYQVSWKDPSFNVSPIGLAHAKLSKKLAERIEDYILTAVKG